MGAFARKRRKGREAEKRIERNGMRGGRSKLVSPNHRSREWGPVVLADPILRFPGLKFETWGARLSVEARNAGPSTRVGAFHAPTLAQDDIRVLIAEDDVRFLVVQDGNSVAMQNSDSSP